MSQLLGGFTTTAGVVWKKVRDANGVPKYFRDGTPKPQTSYAAAATHSETEVVDRSDEGGFYEDRIEWRIPTVNPILDYDVDSSIQWLHEITETFVQEEFEIVQWGFRYQLIVNGDPREVSRAHTSMRPPNEFRALTDDFVGQVNGMRSRLSDYKDIVVLETFVEAKNTS